MSRARGFLSLARTRTIILAGFAGAAAFPIAGCGSESGTSTAAGGALGDGGALVTGGVGAGGVLGGGAGGGTSRNAGGTMNAGGSGSVGANGGSAFGGTSVGGSSGGVAGIGGATGGRSAGGAPALGGPSASAGSASRGGASAAGGRSAGGSSSGGATASTGGSTAGGAPGELPTVAAYIAGDSTVSTYADTSATNDQAGWGQMLHEIFNDKVKIVNRAAGGRTAYWFYLEGAVTTILNQIKPGDYLFIQFGTNDQNTTATFEVDGKTYPRYADTATFKTQLKQYYLDPTKAKSAIPVLVTPPPRNSAYCNGGNGLSAYATAMVELGKAENVSLLDNNAKTVNYLKAICPKPSSAADETFFKNNDGSIDGTHFQENGARKMAGFIGEEIRRVNLGLSAYLR